ncbi:hypothetical protein HZF08_16350 [Paenibacillus sp. CGMCC 1.16610]|uniref:Uncharacterized protein n=2 Tax=Paenibacillus TaxID=44249 RepID=A0ABU6DBT3_9BACL|nr:MULTISPECIES: hypothetical protein [Paenibacillus]MBA2939884.1 hypothetical protein [Paenibacillus sp. CGMCC 1.16610]MCY9656394.1 hypothetical protein [Paenibacillus anseongense]MEB4795218.1 hypothetical protein [Paenibacillus chondroitinus]MVQ39544.1 hypothetical protein [Paenibacillus anseongense]
MDEEEIKALEPKYTGNQRHLTEGEAEGIVHDPNFKNEDEDPDGVDVYPAGVAFGVFRKP